MAKYKADLKQVCGCALTVQGQSTDEVVAQVKQHALGAHGIRQVPPELAEKLMKAIRQE